MRAEIISIGFELLSGKIDDTNATWISRRLMNAGIDVARRITVGDEMDIIVETLRDVSLRADMAIVTGGLGPTNDDITMEAAASAFDQELVAIPEIEQRITTFYKSIGIEMPDSVLRQARVPRDAEVILNPQGTAPGVFMEAGKCEFVFFPGVPREMMSMLDGAIKRIADDAGHTRAIVAKTFRTIGVGESWLEKKLPEALVKCANPTLSFLPGKFEVELRLTAHGETEDECLALISKSREVLMQSVGETVYSEDDTPLEGVVYRKLKESKQTISFAESCTAGLVASRLASIAGASNVMRGGIIAYSNEVKRGFLGVSESALESFGPVSKEVAIEMALGALKRFGTDVAVSVTGNAGPTSGDDKSTVGMIFAAIVFKDASREPVVAERNIKRDRNDVRWIASSMALDLARRNIS